MATKVENRSKWVRKDDEMVYVEQKGGTVTFQAEGQNAFVLEMGAGAGAAYDSMGPEVDRGPVLQALHELEQWTAKIQIAKAEARKAMINAYELGASIESIAKVGPLARPGVTRMIARHVRQMEKANGDAEAEVVEDYEGDESDEDAA